MSGPLKGIKVLEFTHAVMGPCAGLMLADMGADVLHVEPVHGDSTRRLQGFGTGYFWFYNRNKKSLAVNIKSKEGRKIIYDLVKEYDVVVENFGPGTMDRLGLGYEDLKHLNKGLIYCSLKGFLSGPYEKRHAMDEVVQMMGGLAYMTGREGDPLRAGTSVIDITGGMFGYIGILQALYEREKTGEGGFVKSALFETCAFLMGQHMAYSSQIDYKIPPMPSRVSAWSIYKVFDTKDNDKAFIGIISEKHWKRFCEVFNWQDWLSDERLKTNNLRIDEREWFIPELEERIRQFTKQEIIEKCEKGHIPFAPISRPEDLFEDEQLNKGNSLMEVNLGDGKITKLPKFPIEYKGTRVEKRLDPPKIGEHTAEVLKGLNIDDATIEKMIAEGIIKTD
ncbi:crotonobetainyl-CoA:carnitine CoA-transferase CaiB-like acyl-CoA transferase [Maribacter vaceletii]|uniref:Crotonobetainyl-CoA:carnitine CoA-transferase CaiB-like acyl-CoA transferase n=1 Tax=Maribacter vaceletii TaxID=1206816 RepID=A0A495EF97_9FLAO|nr:CaiB/BaiF CoA-transferase family protein [Maribacter vaceletii]RKR15203.1 crotonobetainyl-CoA:carnitine CoA-transferase CaiB-like acyl-CoA transferase [Maribacter vaceletii]